MTWLSSAEAAELAGVAQNTIRSWVYKGILPRRVDDEDRLTFDSAEVEALAFGQAKPRVAPTPKQRGKAHATARTAKRLALLESAMGGRLRVVRCPLLHTWQVWRGGRLVKPGLPYAAALEIACRLADSDRAAARRQQVAQLMAERFDLDNEES